jgi:hypothetical protein
MAESETPKPGWWRADDGNWYPPDSLPPGWVVDPTTGVPRRLTATSPRSTPPAATPPREPLPTRTPTFTTDTVASRSLAARAWERVVGWPRSAKIVAPIAALAIIVAAIYALGRDGNSTPDTSAPPGTFAACKDGTFSDDPEFSDTCSNNKGVARWLAPYVLCKSGEFFELSQDASCAGRRGGVDRLLTESEARAIGTFSTSTTAG